MRDLEMRWIRDFICRVRSVQQDVHAIYQDQHSKNCREQPPQKIVIDSEIRLPEAISEYYGSENTEGPNDRRRDKIRLGVEIVGLLAAVLAAIFTFRSLYQMQRQTNAAESQAISARKSMVVS
jgi:hypothetical protein